jgi:hypothetical protein
MCCAAGRHGLPLYSSSLPLLLRLYSGAASGGGRRQLVAILVLISGVCAWFAHQNHFEWLFNPNPDDSYATIDEADFVAGNDMVLAVEINGDHVAYPVRLLAYHHLINDVVGGTPVVSTKSLSLGG